MEGITKDEEDIIDALPDNTEPFWTPARKERLSTIFEKLGVGLLAAPLVQVWTRAKLDLSWDIMVICGSAVVLLFFSILVANTEV